MGAPIYPHILLGLSQISARSDDFGDGSAGAAAMSRMNLDRHSKSRKTSAAKM